MTAPPRPPPDDLAQLIVQTIHQALAPIRALQTQLETRLAALEHLPADVTALREKLIVLEATRPLEDQLRSLNHRLLDVEARAVRDESVR